MSIDLAMFRGFLETPPGTGRVARAPGLRTWMVRGALIAASAGLAAYDGAQLYHNLTAVVPHVAYLESEIDHIVTPSSGRLAFLADTGSVSAGEPILGVQLPNGKTTLVDADVDESVIAQDTGLGTHVNRGDPILSVASANPPLYLRAILTRAEAFDVAQGSAATFKTFGSSQGLAGTLTVDPTNVSLTPIPPARPGADPMFEVKVQVDAAGQRYDATPVDLQFNVPLGDRVRRIITGLGLPVAVADTVASWLGAAARPLEQRR
jgi:hypothetical protein